MTKTAITIAALIILSAMTVSGQNKVSGFEEIQVNTSGGTTTAQLNLSAERPITPKVGVFGYALLSRNYSEAYAGVTYAPKPWIQLAGGVGAESPRNLRLGGYVWTKYNLLVLEGKGSGFWYKNTTTLAVSKGGKIGLRIQRFKGVGPYAEFDIPHSRLRVWGTALISGQGATAQFGLRVKF